MKTHHRAVLLVTLCAIAGCGSALSSGSPASVPVEIGDLTPELAKAALLDRIRSAEDGALSHYDHETLSVIALEPDPDGNLIEWGPFTLNVAKRKYFFGILAGGREDGHVVDFKGEFVKVAGRWVATESTNAP